MKLKVINSGSKGNAYILQSQDEALLIECGVRISDIKNAFNFDFSKLVGCIVTHEHGDHAKSIKDLMHYGIDVHATEGTHAALQTSSNHRAKSFELHETFKLGNFKIMPFDIMHDAVEPCGFLIDHPECGKVLFITDLIFCAYTFPNLNNIIIEANYDEAIAKRKLNDMEFLRNRIIKNHMSLDTCVKTLKANDLSKVNNIVLIHLSDSNSDELMFKDTVAEATGKTVSVANAGLTIDFNKTPF
ncbi:MBL fold metallo-hydrolase [Winogradskyella forsetii]|uniref:MBL fold metallo-hydrolase n=1 Tax=Winogradskyella forsetii TaxID=2686077 RepID=UPI0015BA7F10|nr:MBL fold metallo-hydrolase [Winogradskyella forsetii]